MGKIIGIDLGTTNSCVSVMEGNEPVVIPNSAVHLVGPERLQSPIEHSRPHRTQPFGFGRRL